MSCGFEERDISPPGDLLSPPGESRQRPAQGDGSGGVYGSALLRLSLQFALPPMNPHWGGAHEHIRPRPDCGVRCKPDRRLGVMCSVSLVSPQAEKLALSAIPPLPGEPAVLGFAWSWVFASIYPPQQTAAQSKALINQRKQFCNCHGSS